MKRLLYIILILSMLFGVVACQATPEGSIVIGKTNGWRTHGAELPNNEAQEPYQAPERYEATLTFDDCTVQIDADVTVPDFSTYPIYIIEPLTFTQELADRIIPLLLDSAELYEENNVRTRDFIQEKIDYYTGELSAAVDGGHEQLIESYQEILADLISELETAPDDMARTPASRMLQFKEVGNSLVMTYGKEIENTDGSSYYEWTEAARSKAAAAGNAAISGTCAQESGRKMYLLLENRAWSSSGIQSSLSFGRPDESGSDWRIEHADFTAGEAIRRGGDLLESMGLSCDLLSCTMMESVNIADNSACYYRLNYRSTIPQTVSANIKSVFPMDYQNRSFAAPLSQEDIIILQDGNGLMGFYWYEPIAMRTKDMDHVALLPWEDICKIVQTMLQVKTVWQDVPDFEKESVIGRRLAIDEIRLCYMQVRKDAEIKERYYIPVWEVCGKLYYKYAEDYDPYKAEGGSYIVDGNNERDVYFSDQKETLSFLTINAIDGSIIDRALGY